MKLYIKLLTPVVILLLTAPVVTRAQLDFQQQVGIVEKLDTVLSSSLVFRNEKGDTVQLISLVDKPTILSLVYFDCPGICPAQLTGIAEVVEKLGMELGKDYKIITVSFNDRDTPEMSVDIKKNYLRDHSRPRAAHWIYLTGDSSNIHALTNAVGYRFSPVGNDFMHPSAIIMLSPDAKVTRYLYGTSYLPFDVKMALVEAQKGQSRPTINRVLEYCFSYDPEGRKYTLQVTKVAATIIIFFAALLFIFLIIRSSRKKTKK